MPIMLRLGVKAGQQDPKTARCFARPIIDQKETDKVPKLLVPRIYQYLPLIPPRVYTYS